MQQFVTIPFIGEGVADRWLAVVVTISAKSSSIRVCEAILQNDAEIVYTADFPATYITHG